MPDRYNEDDLLPISGLQHFVYCERQWGLIHVESQWVENVFTAEGKQLHERVDDPYFTQSRGNVKIIRSVALRSLALGLYGVADVIEIHKTKGADLGLNCTIVEYKRGKPKPDDRDEVQLCAQAMCLEEMQNISVVGGEMYYGLTKHRQKIELNVTLRNRVRTLAEKMHALYRQGVTPRMTKSKKCKNCSMLSVCLPHLGDKAEKVVTYMDSILESVKDE